MVLLRRCFEFELSCSMLLVACWMNACEGQIFGLAGVPCGMPVSSVKYLAWLAYHHAVCLFHRLSIESARRDFESARR